MALFGTSETTVKRLIAEALAEHKKALDVSLQLIAAAIETKLEEIHRQVENLIDKQESTKTVSLDMLKLKPISEVLNTPNKIEKLRKLLDKE